eukprot:g12451.t1
MLLLFYGSASYFFGADLVMDESQRFGKIFIQHSQDLGSKAYEGSKKLGTVAFQEGKKLAQKGSEYVANRIDDMYKNKAQSTQEEVRGGGGGGTRSRTATAKTSRDHNKPASPPKNPSEDPFSANNALAAEEVLDPFSARAARTADHQGLIDNGQPMKKSSIRSRPAPHELLITTFPTHSPLLIRLPIHSPLVEPGRSDSKGKQKQSTMNKNI